jgi:Uma2 family endonuclease
MASTLAPATQSLADVIARLGGIAASRICVPDGLRPATEADVIALQAQKARLCELVDGMLVEKAMGIRESFLAIAIAGFLRAFVVPRNLGLVAGADGLVRLFAGTVRMPDVAFFSWDRLPNRQMPKEAIAPCAPDLAVEVLSEGNTSEEMARKRADYFGAGVRLVWEVDPEARTVAVYTSPDQVTSLGEQDILEGGDVLPGFRLALRDLFAELDRKGN